MGLLSEMFDDKIRLVKTALLYSSYLVLGVNLGVVGPTLLDLRSMVGASAVGISAIFPVGSVGYMVGSVVGGLVYDRLNHSLTFAILCGLMAVLEAVMPWNRSLIALCVTQFFLSVGAGGVDAAANVWIFQLWGKASAPFMQGLHFMFGLGAFVAPLIAEPFLMNQDVESVDFRALANGEEFRLWCPYTINAVIGVITTAGLVVMYSVDKSEDPKQTNEERKTGIEMSTLKKCLILAILCIIFHFYVGLEMSFGRFITSFAFFSDLHLNKSIGAYMTSVYWGTFTFLRLATVFIVAFVGNKTVIFASIVVVLIGNILLVIMGNSSETVLWIGVSLTGLGASSIFATLFTYTEELTPVTTRIASLFLVATAMGEFTIPLAVGSYVESQPMIMFYITTAAAIVCLLFFIGLCIITRDIKP